MAANPCYNELSDTRPGGEPEYAEAEHSTLAVGRVQQKPRGPAAAGAPDAALSGASVVDYDSADDAAGNGPTDGGASVVYITAEASEPTTDGSTFLYDVGASGNPDHAENPGYYNTVMAAPSTQQPPTARLMPARLMSARLMSAPVRCVSGGGSVAGIHLVLRCPGANGNTAAGRLRHPLAPPHQALWPRIPRAARSTILGLLRSRPRSPAQCTRHRTR